LLKTLSTHILKGIWLIAHPKDNISVEYITFNYVNWFKYMLHVKCFHCQ